MDLFSYTDYRSFLRNYVVVRKNRESPLSLGVWAKSLKLGGASSLSMIINGQRHPGPDVSKKLATYFKFNESERSYFLGLIQLGKSRNQSEVSYLLKERTAKLNPKRIYVSLMRRMFGLLSSWIPLRY